jgi:hypothetical protein
MVLIRQAGRRFNGPGHTASARLGDGRPAVETPTYSGYLSQVHTQFCGYRYVVVSAEPAAIANASPPTVSRVSMRQDESAWNLHGHRPRVKQFPNDGEMMVVVLRNKDR